MHLILSALEQSLGHLVLLYDVHLSTPTRKGISVNSTKEGLGNRFEQVVGALFRINVRTWTEAVRIRAKTHQSWLPETLAGTKKLFTSCPTDNKILGKINTANTVKSANKWLTCRLVDSGHHRTDEERSKPSLIQRRTDQVGKRLWCNVAFLPEPVHVDLVTEQI